VSWIGPRAEQAAQRRAAVVAVGDIGVVAEQVRS
jgi:hypothetical protein